MSQHRTVHERFMPGLRREAIVFGWSLALLISLQGLAEEKDAGKKPADPKPAAEKPGEKPAAEKPGEKAGEKPGAEKAAAEKKSPPSLITLSLEELMQVSLTQTTVSRVPERVIESPGSVYVYPRDMILRRGYRSLGELLQTVPGFTVFHRDLQFVVGVRGLNANDNDKISLLVNGQRVLGLHEQEFLNGPINLDNVERVEVVVGPSAFFQQANTLAATVNVITRNQQGVEVIASVGNDLVYSGTVMFGKKWADDKFLSFSMTSERKRGFDAWDSDFQPGLAGRDVTGELVQPNYFSILNGRYGEITAQAIAFRTNTPELHIENAAKKNDADYIEQFYSVYVKDEHRWTDTLTSVFSIAVARKEQTRLNKHGLPADSVEQSVKQWSYESDLGVHYSGFKKHQIQAGVQATYENNFDTFFSFNNDATNEHIPRTTLVDEDTYALGFYADDEYQLSDRVKLVGGVRVDKNTRLKGNKWYPAGRAAIIAMPKDFWTAKLMYNRAVRFPSPLQALNKVWGANNPDTPDKPLFADLSPTPSRPEILSTVELQNIFQVGKYRLGTTVYRQDLKDFITWFSPHSNGGDFDGFGVEMNFQAQFHPRVSLWANGAFNDSKLHLFEPDLFGPPTGRTEEFHANINPDERIIGSAKYTANAGLDYKILDNLLFSPSLRYFTDQAAVDFRPAPDAPRFINIRNRVYLDAGLSWNNIQGQNLDARLTGHNLLDNRDPVGSQIQGDTIRPRGREIVFSISFRF